MGHRCFTAAESKRWGFDHLSHAEIMQRLRENTVGIENSLRQQKLQAIIVDRQIAKIFRYTNAKGEIDPAAGLKAMLYTDRYEQSGSVGLEALMRALNGKSHSELHDIMHDFVPDWKVFMQDTKAQHTFVKALFGEQTADPRMRGFAQTWAATVEGLRVRFNKAGGGIHLLDSWRLPQHHDAHLVSKATFPVWKADILDSVDLVKMKMDQLSSDDLDAILKRMYDNIATDGLSSLKQGLFIPTGTSKMANRHMDSRKLHFKDADSWVMYQNKYSNSTPYAAMMDHISMINNEIASMEMLGPNPDITFNTLVQAVQKHTGDHNSTRSATNAYINLTGKTAPNNRPVADSVQALRNITTGIKLPGATLSALPDVMFNAFTAHYNGIPVFNTFVRMIKNLNPLDKADQKFAAQMWMPLEHLIDTAHAAMRYSDVGGTDKAAKFAGMVMNMSGLNQWTVAGKRAFHIEFMGSLAGDIAGNVNLQRAFRRYGITARDQRLIQRSTKLNRNGVDYLDPSALPGELAERVIAMVTSETRYAVPEGDAMVRAMLNQGSRKGEAGGETLRVMTQFKNFPATIIANHWARMAHGFEGNKASRAAYGASMMVGTTLLGTLVVQLKAISRGEESPTGKRLITEGAMAGGVMSLMGDVMASDSRAYGQAFQEFALGPLGSDINKLVWDGILGTLDDMTAADKGIQATLAKLPKDIAAGATNYVPGQFWYSKNIMERSFLDEIRRWADPEFDIKEADKEVQRQMDIADDRWFR